MFALLKLFFLIFLFVIVLGAFISIFIFAFDVIKWHPKEVRFEVKPSKVLNSLESGLVFDGRCNSDNSCCSDSGTFDNSGSDSGNSDNCGSDSGNFFDLCQ